MSLIDGTIDDSGARRKLDALSDIPAWLAPAMRDAVLYVQSRIPAYPPPPPQSRYRRTGTLGRTVTTLQGQDPHALARVETLGGIVGYVGSSLDYAPYVIDADRQASMHRNRWWTLQAVVAGARQGVVAILQAAVDKLAKG